LLRVSATYPFIIRRRRRTCESEGSFRVSAHPDPAPDLLFEATTQQVGLPDCPAIATVYRPPSSSFPPGDTAEGEMSPAAMTMPRRLLLMVHELHGRGYQRLRIAPGLSPSGCHWRCAVTPVTNISRSNGAMLWDYEAAVARYTTGQGTQCFGWTDAVDDPPGQLATKFLDRYAELCEGGRGRDESYARWYSGMLAATEPGGLIYAYADRAIPEDLLPVLGASEEVWIPPPPPGEGGIEPVWP
jgi:hypothetical protein